MVCKKITDEQLEGEIQSGLTLAQIADKYGMNKRSIEARSAKLSKRGLGHGQMKNVRDFIPDGYRVKGTSTLIGDDGKQKIQWIKSEIDRERELEMIQAAMDAFCDELPRFEPIPDQKNDYSESLCLYPVFDLHIGALAHKHESGENYSTDIAEQTMNKFFDYALLQAPPSEKAVLLIGGDFLHSDGLEAVTPASGHCLDQDSRYAKLVYVAVRATRRAVSKMLTKHREVEIQIIEGNHDQSGMIWLRAAMAAHYEDEPRVTVDTSPRVVHHTQYGKTFLAYHHGHTVRKAESLMMMCAADWKEDFGISNCIYAHMGHYHHQTVTETSLGIVEIHSTMAGKDAYAARGGWRSRRRAAVIVYDKEHGEVGRFMYYPEMML